MVGNVDQMIIFVFVSVDIFVGENDNCGCVDTVVYIVVLIQLCGYSRKYSCQNDNCGCVDIYAKM